VSRLRRRLASAGWYLLLTAVMLVTAVPFAWAALMSIRETAANPFPRNRPAQVLPYPGLVGWGEGLREARATGEYAGPGGWWRDYGPEVRERLEGTRLEPYTFPATTENYYRVAQDIAIGRYFMNSLLVALGAVALTLLLCSLAAYPLAKLRFAGRDVLFIVVLSTLIFPEQLILIPLYVMAVNVFGFQNSFYGLILPFAASGLGIFLLRQIYYAIPDELIEAARIDGASEFGIWWRILLPLIRPGLATLAIITFVGSWNNFLWPLLMLSDTSLFTLPVGLSYLRGFFSGSLRTVAAGIVIATVPIIIVFMIFQRQFIQGLSGAVKG
jgi:putative chitobiose transport system permease protein